jgi:predicted permease
MQLNSEILNTMLAIMLPIAFGYLLKLGRIFQESEVAALRKFVMRVALPFLIFQNLYRADVATLQQALPIVLAFVLLTAFYTLARQRSNLEYIKEPPLFFKSSNYLKK